MPFHSLRARVAFFFLPCVAGCGAAPGRGEDSSRHPATPAERVVTSPADSLDFRLDLPTDVRAGDTVPIVLRLENRTARPLELYLRGRTIAFDVIVAREGGQVVWQRLEGEIVPAILQLRVLARGEVLELRTAWDQRTRAGRPAVAGRYVVRGMLLTDGPAALESAPATLRIGDE